MLEEGSEEVWRSSSDLLASSPPSLVWPKHWTHLALVPWAPKIRTHGGSVLCWAPGSARGVGMAGWESPKELRGGVARGAVASLVPLDSLSRLGGCPRLRLNWGGGAHGLV